MAPNAFILKISVLASGAVLIDGKPTGLDQLDEALEACKASNGQVWYYREAAAHLPPPQGMAVMQLVIKHKLPISLSSKPDFSDVVDAQGVSHPRDAAPATAPQRTHPINYDPRMPDVRATGDLEQVFARVREAARGEKGQRGLVIVLPERTQLLLPAMAQTPALKSAAAGLERLIPPSPSRSIAVIAYTGFVPPGAVPGMLELAKAIPFLGMLMGLTYIGHAVWIFEGHASALTAGCRDADVLIVDSGMLPSLAGTWAGQAAAAMRNANILIQDRAPFQLRVERKTGTAGDRLEFPN